MSHAEHGPHNIPEDHYMGVLAGEFDVVDGIATGSAPVRPEVFIPGTTRIRAGVLATLVDLVAGHVPAGAVNPTVDLRLSVFAAPPTDGRVHLTARALRAGKRLIVAETELAATPGGTPFARAVTTFMNAPLGTPLSSGPKSIPPMAERSMDEYLAPRVHDARTIEMDAAPRISNGPAGTVQGGAQTLFAELAAEHGLGTDHQGARGRLAVSDLDIRFLGRLSVGPLVGTVESIPSDDPSLVHARVRLTDGGRDHAIVSFVAITATRL